MAINTQAQMQDLAWNEQALRKTKGVYAFVKKLTAGEDYALPAVASLVDASGNFDPTWLTDFKSLGMTDETPTSARESETDGGFTPKGSFVAVRDELVSASTTFSVKTAEGDRIHVKEIVEGADLTDTHLDTATGALVIERPDTPVWNKYALVLVELDVLPSGLHFTIDVETKVEVKSLPSRDDVENNVVFTIEFARAAGSKSYQIKCGAGFKALSAGLGYTTV